MKTHFDSSFFILTILFVYILPLRNENKNLTATLYLVHYIVYILPLRNENQHKNDLQTKMYLPSRLYPTFKEWKLESSVAISAFVGSVYILPLRNENKTGINSSILLTCLYPTFKEWKPRRTRQSEKVSRFISYL